MNLNAMSGYMERQRDISFETSSGDKVSISMLKKDTAEAYTMSEGGSTSGEFSFSSLEKFSFQVEGNGLSEQDKAEIDQMMEKIQPLIDEFFDPQEGTPYNELVNKISAPFKELEAGVQEMAKSVLVDAFDNQLKLEEQKTPEKIEEEKIETFEQFLQDILYKIDATENYFYA